ncbi:metalloprotease PmbA [Psychrosphaera saromensis]|uniref:Metalloprotease PmbA n=1 Tax=Psychrosphaera saromensis TaxID=716813 RepID=A0A2S7UT95_9GAMM|nr:metalloprotease PmbA [Psychrosphaera saromensis]PQJ53206.1 metalloprotease PmbA [Psychrosphaera saromensis]GHB67168.1 metalloprotease PmbA [Psychrosphaera saromensis]GLQ15031.1 metalloprotease PmbA [Psychrosphaera saromensis]
MTTKTDIFNDIDQVKTAIADLLSLSKKYGADSAEAVISKSKGITVSSRCQELENIEFNQEGALGISIYVGKHKGSASTADLSHAALEQTVKAAVDIAKYTSADEFSGLVEQQELATNIQDLDLFHPHQITPEQGLEYCIESEKAAFEFDKRITNSDGASLSSYQGFKVYGNSLGFIEGYPSTRHSLSCSVISQDGDEMQRDYAYTVDREFNKLDGAILVGQKAAEAAVSMLNARKLDTCQLPVIFHAEIASSLFGHLVSAISGGSLYRKSSFLMDSLGKSIFPELVNVSERPHTLKGLASSPFDSEGVATHDREIIEGGVLTTYLLTGYSARKMGMKSTGHAGGIHNWLVKATDPDLTALLKKMDKGLLVTELMGQGVNTVTGDYSRGAAGFWVENGELQYPVSEITIAGNLTDMFKQIVGIGGDVEKRGAVQTGSILIENMQIAGN